MRTALSSCFSLLLLASCSEYNFVGEPVDVNPADVTDCGFTPVSSTKLSVYDCNPVFSGSGEDWGSQVDAVGFYATDVLGHPFYQLWYSARPDGSETGAYGLGYAISSNGTDWDIHPENPLLESPAGAWDQDAMDAIQVVWDPASDQYILAYQGYNLSRSDWGMGIATSFDGVEWNRIPDPVVDFSETLSGVSYCWPLGVSNTASGGLAGYITGQPSDRNVCQIYPLYANSIVDWSPSNQPLLRAGPETYDQSGMASAAVVEYGDTQYMFYVGFSGWQQFNGYQTSQNHSLNLATSTDGGQTWSKSPRNPIPVALTSSGEISAVAAQVIGNRIHLWVTDYYESVGGQAVGYYLFEPEIEAHE